MRHYRLIVPVLLVGGLALPRARTKYQAVKKRCFTSMNKHLQDPKTIRRLGLNQ